MIKMGRGDNESDDIVCAVISRRAKRKEGQRGEVV